MYKFNKPECDVVRFGNDVIVTSTGCPSDCTCDFGFGPMGDNDICTGGTGEGGNIQCIQTDTQGNC